MVVYDPNHLVILDLVVHYPDPNLDPDLCVQLVVHDPLEAPGGVAGGRGGQAVLLDVEREHRELARRQLADVLKKIWKFVENQKSL